ncbi:bone morphogenetic protein receptor type-2 [Episyrphus balteatus]|uniref:bone morphogenetic protein receptor type-2 n=1 Tax=Episyrphus balteatus TaxID=286459 RepID=UPI00248500A1|nr:bone morphogenetic protein receptor type-2 [Episyrphus balteatus]XP_055841132.1 bone morphogenetic protein receptor type-2 [Episyrphus balteatus]XP_055841133.1 bone morphogenetic protein receptor type-2 [Episyrphus balteatus]
MATNYLTLLTIIALIAHASAVPKSRICAQFPEDDSSQDDDDYSEYVSSSSPEAISSTSITKPSIGSNSGTPSNFVECSQDYEFCFGLWFLDTNGTKIVKQGCWKESGDRNVTCVQKECLSIGHKRTNGAMNLYYCCCSGDMCNQNMTVSYPLELSHVIYSGRELTSEELGNTQSASMLNPIFLIGICIAIGFLMTGFLFIRCRKPNNITGPEEAPLAPSGPGYSSNLHNVDNLKVCSLIGQGKYGTVWKGMINEKAVAVKIFPAQHKQCFINEKNIYSLPLMDSPSLLSYIGCDERRNMEDQIEYFLVLSLAPLGCLQDWLIANTMSFGTFCKMAKTITRGLSHLHTELQRGDDLKPCIAHRDLNTRNILVNADLSCSIADFGFALKVFGSKYEYRGEIALAETKSINEVGTLRYMAPEILEGAVNLRDCESALKQTDVYSLGLCLWELCTRCSDFYAYGQAVPAYKSPYESEVGKHPTFEQMQVLVARHKARPLFPSCWGGAAAGKLIKDTCEDCWDHDAEARLTSLCAEERMHELSNLRPHSHISLGHGPSPPLSANNFVGQSPTRRLRSLSSNSCNLESEQTIVTPPNQIIPRVRSCGNEATTTISALQTPSVAEKNHLIYSQQLQPYQGRNPCQERNLAPVALKTIPVLVEKSKKHSFQDKSQDNSFSCLEDDVSVEDLISSNSKKLTQDTVHMGQGFPKQNNTDKKLRGWHGVRALIQKKLFRKDFYQTFDEKSNLVDNRNITKSPLDQFTSPTKNTTVNLIETKHHNSQHNSILTTIDSASTRRPNNLDLVPITVRVNGLSPENKSNLIKSISEECHNSMVYPPAEIPIPASIQSDVVDSGGGGGLGSTTRMVVSRSANAVKKPSTPQSVAEEKQIVRQRSLEIFREVFNARGSSTTTDKRLRNPSQRVKTPGDVPPSVRKVRASKTLSLYDDRMMDSSTLNIL